MTGILWFGARTIYRVEKSNTVASPNKLYEERIVLISANSADEALVNAEKEAEIYASAIAKVDLRTINKIKKWDLVLIYFLFTSLFH